MKPPARYGLNATGRNLRCSPFAFSPYARSPFGVREIGVPSAFVTLRLTGIVLCPTGSIKLPTNRRGMRSLRSRNLRGARVPPAPFGRAGSALRPASWVGVVAAAPRRTFVWSCLLARCRLHMCSGFLVSSGLRPVPVWRGCRSRVPARSLLRVGVPPPPRSLPAPCGRALPCGRATGQRYYGRAPLPPFGRSLRPPYPFCPPFGRAFVSHRFVAPFGRCDGVLPIVRDGTLDAPSLRSERLARWLGPLRSPALSPVAMCGSVRSCVYGALRGPVKRPLSLLRAPAPHCVRGLLWSLRSHKNV